MDTATMNDILNERIKLRMAEIGTNATHAALDSGLGKTAVRDIVSGKTKSPTVDTLGRLATTLKCTVSYLLGDVDHPLKFRPSDQEVSDVQLTHVTLRLRAGVFEKQSKKAESYGIHPIYGHPGTPEHILKLMQVGDDSMVAAGIFKNDIVTVAMPYDENDFNLYSHKFVVSVRFVIPPGIEEVSLREVVLADDGIILTTRPEFDAPDLIKVGDPIPAKSTKNAYVTNEGHGLTILGFVIRVTRNIPEF